VFVFMLVRVGAGKAERLEDWGGEELVVREVEFFWLGVVTLVNGVSLDGNGLLVLVLVMLFPVSIDGITVVIVAVVLYHIVLLLFHVRGGPL